MKANQTNMQSPCLRRFTRNLWTQNSFNLIFKRFSWCTAAASSACWRGVNFWLLSPVTQQAHWHPLLGVGKSGSRPKWNRATDKSAASGEEDETTEASGVGTHTCTLTSADKDVPFYRTTQGKAFVRMCVCVCGRVWKESPCVFLKCFFPSVHASACLCASVSEWMWMRTWNVTGADNNLYSGAE